MSIEVPVLALYGLADALTASAGTAEEARDRLAAAADPGPALESAAAACLSAHRTAAGALAGELRWLGATVAEVADSWLRLDDALLARRGQIAAR